MFSFARSVPCYGWFAEAVKAQDELAALGLDCHRSPTKRLPAIRAKENIRYELTQSQ